MPLYWSVNGVKKIKSNGMPYGFPYLGRIAGQDLYADPELLGERKLKSNEPSPTELAMSADTISDPMALDKLIKKRFKRQIQAQEQQYKEFIDQGMFGIKFNAVLQAGDPVSRHYAIVDLLRCPKHRKLLKKLMEK